MAKSFDKILQYPDPILRAKSVDVKIVNNDIINLFQDLERLAKKNSKEGVTLVGLSAPQVGLNVNAFVFYDFKKKKYVENEPIIGNVFTIDQKVAKVAFRFVNPDRLIEFY